MDKEKIRNLSFYCIYTRNHSKSGSFQSIIDDLARIDGMGIDVIWLLPIHPIGITNRKGTLGSPYSITNYREVNREHGTLEDFCRLINEVHRRGMRLMIDIVFRHTSDDCTWGKPIASVPSWTDILDLKFEGNENSLWVELIDILKYWCQLGVDGFRMDVAAGVTIQFWRQARNEISKNYPNTIWLAESTRLLHIERSRAKRELVNTDSTLYEVFDICYDYDLYGTWRAVIVEAMSVKTYLELMRLQTMIYPSDFIKLRFVENHDQERMSYICRDNRSKALAWTAFSAFNKGCFLVHAGQESEQTKTSSLFEKDWVDCQNIRPLQEFLRQLIQIKKHPVIQSNHSNLVITAYSPCIVTIRENQSDRQGLIGLFNVSQHNTDEEYIQIDNLPDGEYQNLLTNISNKDIPPFSSSIVSNNGRISVPPVAAVFHYSGFNLQPKMFYSEIFDFDYKGY